MTKAVADHFKVIIVNFQKKSREVQQFCENADNGRYGFGLILRNR